LLLIQRTIIEVVKGSFTKITACTRTTFNKITHKDLMLIVHFYRLNVIRVYLDTYSHKVRIF
jgi:hypothetical protein